jgi:integrator complex subunit 12
MAAVELDPVFVRALRLLHSKSKDSTTQLKSMLDDAIRHRKGLGPGPTGFISVSPQRKSNASISNKRGEAEKRSLDKLKHELSELVPSKSSFGDSKRARLTDSPRSAGGFSSKSHTPSPTPPGSRGEFASDKNNHSSGSGGNSSEAEESSSAPSVFVLSAPSVGADVMELDMNLEGLGDCTCCVCKSFNQESGNKLMDCHTCQNLFHQGCHEPPVANEEANDPRLVWNCTECIKKQVHN